METGISKKVLRKIPPPLAYVVIPYMLLVSKPREGTFRYRERTWRLLFLIHCKTGFLQIVGENSITRKRTIVRSLMTQCPPVANLSPVLAAFSGTFGNGELISRASPPALSSGLSVLDHSRRGFLYTSRLVRTVYVRTV